MSWFGHTYTQHIREPGKAGFFWLLIGIVAGFGFIRVSTRLIRAEVSWWPHNVTPGGLHLHHMLFGMVFMVGSGGVMVGLSPGLPGQEILAFVFGVGVGLVLDEFALMLFLDDVYWREEGRISLDAVLLAVALLTLLLVTVHPAGTEVSAAEKAIRLDVFVHVLITVPLVLVCLLKGKVYTALIGPFAILFVIIGAIRVAKPGTPWARARYGARPARQAKAIARYPPDRRVARLHRSVLDVIGGAPSQPVPPGADAAEHTADEPRAPSDGTSDRTVDGTVDGAVDGAVGGAVGDASGTRWGAAEPAVEAAVEGA